MKKFISLVLSTTMCLPLMACGGNSDDSQQTEMENTESQEETQTVEVDEGIFDVEITVPADFLEEGTTQDDLDAIAEESDFKSVTLNDDGSATYVMTKAQHEKMMAELKESINQSLAEMIDPETYPSFSAITANDSFTQFTVELTTNEVGLAESMSVIAFYVLGGMYNAFNGTPVDDISVRFINAETGELIQEAHSSEAVN